MKTRDKRFKKLNRQVIIISSSLCALLLIFTTTMIIFSNLLLNLDKSNNHDCVVVNAENVDNFITNVDMDDYETTIQDLELIAIFIIAILVTVLVWLSILFNKYYELKLEQIKSNITIQNNKI